MDKAQALDAFFNSFGWPAFDENTVEAENERQYITYEVITGDAWDDNITINPALYDYSNSYERVEKKAAEIKEYLLSHRPPSIKIDGGRLVIAPGRPFSQRVDSGSVDWRKIVLNIDLAFLTN